MISELRAVIFDWAGTLVDHGALAPVEAFVSVFESEGVALAAAEARLPMGLDKHEHVETLLALPGVAARWHAAKGHAPTRADIDRLYAALEPALAAAIPHHQDTVPGAVHLLRDLRRQGLKIGSTTGYSRRALEPVLDFAARQGLEVQAVVCAGDTPRSRPHADQMVEVLRRLGVDEPYRCVKVDDTPTGIEEGLACGAWTVGVTLSGNAAGLSAEELNAASPDTVLALRRTAEGILDGAGAHYLVDSLIDIPPVLEDIAHRISHGELPPQLAQMQTAELPGVDSNPL